MKIYVRERQKIGSGVKEPKFRVVAVTGGKGEESHLKIEATHFRKTEIEGIAKDVGAEIIYLLPMPEEKRGEMKSVAR
ncbi:hypothetical protein [Methanofollis ethanolicus]|uniref:hypothetical protein n=1 Tax=Methanofollis ethanolicus TaxID=488124 RepID=UPI00082DA097|nr:hypothetical protein [Methanofollis ethanolicus]